MKKSLLAALVAIMLLLATLLWIFKIHEKFNVFELIEVSVIFLLVIFGFYYAWRQMRSAHRGEPGEDEYSKKVMQKSAALSYYISLYLWVAMIYIEERVDWDVEAVIGSGIVGMGVIFAVSWLVFNYRGIRE